MAGPWFAAISLALVPEMPMTQLMLAGAPIWQGSSVCFHWVAPGAPASCRGCRVYFVMYHVPAPVDHGAACDQRQVVLHDIMGQSVPVHDVATHVVGSLFFRFLGSCWHRCRGLSDTTRVPVIGSLRLRAPWLAGCAAEGPPLRPGLGFSRCFGTCLSPPFCLQMTLPLPSSLPACNCPSASEASERLEHPTSG